MQQPPYDQVTRAPRAGRTNPALPSVRVSTTPVYVSAAQRQRWPQLPAGKRTSRQRRVFLQFFLLGLLLCLCFWLLYPLFGAAAPGSSVAQVLTRSWPWLLELSWLRRLPGLASLFERVSWLNVKTASPVGFANLALVLLGVAGLLLFLTSRVAGVALKERFSRQAMLGLLLVICLFTLLLGTFCVVLPGGLSQEALLSGVYGRLLVVYHANPYTVHASALNGDVLYHALPPGAYMAPGEGPLWLDLTIVPAWLAQGNPALIILSFRALGLFVHLLNALLLWGVLARLKPEARLSGTLLYAWNPAVLLLGVGEVQVDLVAIFFLLLGAFLLQRRSLLLSWACFVLATLINPLTLLLLPLLLRALLREVRLASRGGRVLWWCACLAVFALIVVLGYAPYWAGLGLNGLGQYLHAIFWPDGMRDSLLTALSNLPFADWAATSWFMTPHNWLVLPALLIGGLLLLGLWIIDTLELALLFGSWIFLILFILLPMNSPWLILLPLVLALASSSRRTALLAHLLTLGALLAYGLEYWPTHWAGLALVTIGVAVLIWGWTLFFLSTWQMTHHEDEEEEPPTRKRLGISRPSWPSRPSAWPSRPGLRKNP